MKHENVYLEYYKMIIEKVSFDSALQRKEYQKAIKVLSLVESEELDKWLIDLQSHLG